MGRTTVALISAAPRGALGSMAALAGLVRDALAEHAPQYDLLPVCLRDSEIGLGRGVFERLAQVRQVFTARQRARRVKADVYHVLDGSFAYLVGGIPWQRTLVSVHDVIPALQARGRFPVPAPGWVARRAIDASLDRIRHAGAVHTISHNTASDLQEISGRVVDEVLLLPLRPLPAEARGGVASPRADPPFILHVGNNGFYKNRPGVVAVFAKLASQLAGVRLVMAGAPPSEALRASVAVHGLQSRVDFVVDPGDRELVSLYRQAAVLLFPSLYEGMGWPPVEAMRYGCPVVCSNAASLPETVGDAAILCDPSDVDAMASAVSRVLSDRDMAAALTERGYRNLGRFEMREFALGLSRLYQKLGAS